MSSIFRGAGSVLLVSLMLIARTGTATLECETHSAHALLIGISDYEPSGERNLEGPSNDVSLMQDLLQRRFDMPSQNIITITNKDATHIGIQNAFDELARRESACDFVYVHYSGHGAQFDNEAKAAQCDREALDQTWVSYGARSKAYSGEQELNNHDVLDDEINQWLTKLDTDDYVFVSDSCHSGTVFRGRVDGVRSAKDYEGKHPLAQAALRCEGDTRGVKIGAARDIEEAIEIRPKLGNDERRVFGRFTWYWAQALEKASPSETWSDVFDRAYALVTTDEGSRKQFPQLTGDANRSIFGGDFQEPKQTVQVIGVSADGSTVTLDSGAVANMTQGSEFSLYRRDAPIAPDLPRLKVADVDSATSVAEVLQGHFEKGDAVIETKHAYAFEPYRLFVDPSCGGAQSSLQARSEDRPLFEHLRSALGKLEGFEMAEGSDSADMLVCVLRPRNSGPEYVRKVSDRPLPQYFADADPEVWVVTQGLKPVHERLKLSLGDPNDGIAKLGENLKAYLRGQEVIRFGLSERPAGKPDIRLYLTLLRETPASACTGSGGCRTLPFEGFEERRYRAIDQVTLADVSTLQPQAEDIIDFRIQNKSNVSLYTYVLNVSKNLAVSVIYPNPDIDARAEYANFKPDEERSLDYAMWQVEAGDADWFKFIASRTPVDVNVFVRPGLAEYRAARSLTSAPSTLEQILGTALHSRGKLMPTPVQAWFAEQAQLSVGDRQ